MTKIDVNLEVEKTQDDELDLYAKLCQVLLQLEEANTIIKHYAERNGYVKATAYLNKWNVQ